MLIINGTIITWGHPNQILDHHAVFIQDDVIIEIGPQYELIQKYPHEEKIDAAGQLVMPGNICAHTHFYGAFSRGMAIPGPAPEAFPQILEKLWWPLDKSLSREDVHYSALVCLIDAIQHGTTTLFDHHASPNAIDGSLDVISDAVIEAGVRACLCYEVTDRDGIEKSKAGISENCRFINKVKSNNQRGMISALFGLHASLTLSEETLEKCRSAVPTGTGYHIHVAEHSIDEYDSLQKTGKRVVDRLSDHGILGENTIVAHGVHIDAREMELLASSQTWVSHQPRSNMNNAVGVAEIESMLRAGVRVCLGNDGFSNAMWEEWKAAYLVHKLWHRDPRRMPGNVVADMAIYNNAQLTSKTFKKKIGELVKGAQADIIFVDYHPYTEMTEGNLPWHILFGFHESMVTTTIVAGKFLMKNRELLTLDAKEIAAKALELSKKTWNRYQQRF